MIIPWMPVEDFPSFHKKALYFSLKYVFLSLKNLVMKLVEIDGVDKH